jgi:hypothetical protein
MELQYSILQMLEGHDLVPRMFGCRLETNRQLVVTAVDEGGIFARLVQGIILNDPRHSLHRESSEDCQQPGSISNSALIPREGRHVP